MRIGCSGPVDARSGIGVVQKHLYAHLADAGHELVFGKPRDTGRAPIARLQGTARGLTPAPGPVDVYLSTVPPLPYRVRAPLLTIVHDLRWMRTRSKIGACYRAWDTKRTVRRSDALLCISEHTRSELVRFAPQAAPKAVVQRLGPGQVPAGSFHDSDSGTVMLVGAAAHKRNELAAAALARARPPWVREIIGVGVSAQVRDTLSKAFRCAWFDSVSEAQMRALYRRAAVLLMLGTDEGFGLPFVEALAAGCQVIAADHRLAREVLGDAGVFVTLGDPGEVGMQLQTRPCVPAAERIARAERFSWRAFGERFEAELIGMAAAESTQGLIEPRKGGPLWVFR